MDNFIPHKRGERYDTEEGRRTARLMTKRKYSAKPWACEVCDISIVLGNKSRHLQSRKHQFKDMLNK